MSKPEYKGTKGEFKILRESKSSIGGHAVGVEKPHIDVWYGMRGWPDDIMIALEDAKTIAAGLNLAQKYGSLEELERQREEGVRIIKKLDTEEMIPSQVIDEFLKSIE